MRCAEFESGLAELVDATPGSANHEELSRRLRAHAQACEECAGSADLLNVLELPPEGRDPVPDPGREYWDGFNRRLEGRLEKTPASTRSGHRWWLSAAAAMLVLGIAGWMAWRLPENGLAKRLEDSLAAAEPDEAMHQVDDLAGWGTSDESELFPDVSDLDAEEQQELLAWLKGQSS